ncbi:unnamed protein product [Callosobruchus maculatus]|uniref:Tetratricopeptide repeat protein 17 n=1 Tax=Callosobruchus maculatus TaxID=64391 RepID=A0A653DFT3_CALMS|nr:unnamed protein product [Callosobruchus maculatus]
MYYMKNVLRADPNYYDGQAERLLRIWGCRIKLGGYVATTHHKDSLDGTTKETCSTGAGSSGGSAFRGEGVVCSANGEQCKNAAIACYKKTGEESPESPVKPSLQCEGGPSHLRNQQLHRDANLGSTIISSLLAATDGSGDSEPDQSRLERMMERSTTTFSATGDAVNGYHMRLSLGDDYHTQDLQALGDFYVALTEDSQAENLLHVYDKFGTYTLSTSTCKTAKIIHKFKYSTVWPSIVIRSLDLTPYLKPKIDNKKVEPHCTDAVKPIPSVPLATLIKSILKHRLPSSPEKDLFELLGLMASDQKMPLKELGAKIGLALKENTTSWILATASAIYWRILGNTEEAVTCLRLALAYVPSDKMDIPLHHLANLLNRVGFHVNALELAQLALKTHHSFVLNHFTVANIHISLGEYEKAVAFYRASLALDSNFEPARVRLQAVLCMLLFDDPNRKQSDTSD